MSRTRFRPQPRLNPPTALCLTAAIDRGAARDHNRAMATGAVRRGLTTLFTVILVGVAGASPASAVGLSIYYDSQRGDAAGQPGIWSMDVNGNNQKGFVPGGSEPSWSSDGSKMIYINGRQPHCSTQGSSGGTVVLVDTSGAHPQNLTGVCGDARLSPDGTHVVFASGPDGVAVMALANPTSSITDLVAVPNQDQCNTDLLGPPARQTACSFGTDASWAGNGTVVYSDDTAEGGGLWSVPAAGGSSDPVSFANDQSAGGIDYGSSGMSVDATGTKAVVSDGMNGDVGASLYVVPMGGSAGTEIARAPAGHAYVFPQWSPDGSTIVFEDQFLSADHSQRLSTIDTVPAGGGTASVLTPGDTTATDPAFGPARSSTAIRGAVTDETETPPIPAVGISVQATGPGGVAAQAVTDANGSYELDLPPGTYTVAPVGGNPNPVSRTVTLTSNVSGVDFVEEPVGHVDLGVAGLSFPIESFSFGTSQVASSLSGTGKAGESTFSVTKRNDAASPKLFRAATEGTTFPVATLDEYAPGTTTTLNVITFQTMRVEEDQRSGEAGQTPGDNVTFVYAAKSLTMISCRATHGTRRLARSAEALVCPLTGQQKANAQAAYDAALQSIADLNESQSGLGCKFGNPDRETRLACAAVSLLIIQAQAQRNAALKLLDDPPDPRFGNVAMLPAVHVGHVGGNRFAAFDRMIRALGRMAAVEQALVTSLNRESGALAAGNKAGVNRQRTAIVTYARRIIGLAGQIARLAGAAHRPLAGLHATGHARKRVAVDFSTLLAGDRAIVAAMRPLTRAR